MNFNIRSRRDFDKSRLGYFWNGLHESSVYIDLVRQMFSKANSGRRDIRKAKWAPRHLEPSTWREDAAPVSLVVTCHIYYEDFLPEFLNLLSKMWLLPRILARAQIRHLMNYRRQDLVLSQHTHLARLNWLEKSSLRILQAVLPLIKVRKFRW